MHRVGRTARLGRGGEALLLLLPSERAYLGHLAAAGHALEEVPLLPLLDALPGSQAGTPNLFSQVPHNRHELARPSRALKRRSSHSVRSSGPARRLQPVRLLSQQAPNTRCLGVEVCAMVHGGGLLGSQCEQRRVYPDPNPVVGGAGPAQQARRGRARGRGGAADAAHGGDWS